MSVKITIEAEGYRMELEEGQFESFGLSIPSDVCTGADGRKELGRTHISLTAVFKEGYRPEWREISG